MSVLSFAVRYFDVVHSADHSAGLMNVLTFKVYGEAK